MRQEVSETGSSDEVEAEAKDQGDEDPDECEWGGSKEVAGKDSWTIVLIEGNWNQAKRLETLLPDFLQRFFYPIFCF